MYLVLDTVNIFLIPAADWTMIIVQFREVQCTAALSLNCAAPPVISSKQRLAWVVFQSID